MNSAKVIVNETDLTFSPGGIPLGISGYAGVTKRGPINKPSLLITSWPQFEKIYGGLVDGNDFPFNCKRALEGGSSLRIANIRHYTDITNPASFDADFAAIMDTRIYSLSTAMISGVTAVFTIGSDDVSQVFATSSINTLNLLAAKIKAFWPTLIQDIVIISGTKLKIVQLSGSTGVMTFTGTGAPTSPIVSSTEQGFIYSGTSLFDLAPKYPGADYNDLRITCRAASNGATDSFDLVIEIVGDPSSVETYRNIKIPGPVTAGNSNYLKAIVDSSYLVDVVYNDLSGITTAPIVPEFTVARFSAGTDGTTPIDADYIGDSASKTGFQAFNIIDDIMQIAAGTDSGPVHVAGAAYASTRKDLMYWAHLANTNTTENALITARQALNINTSYAAFFAGGLTVVDPLTSQNKDISELGDILGLAAVSDAQNGPWWSFSAAKRGTINNALGIVNNFGAEGNSSGMDSLSNAQINTVINRGGKMMLWGSFTAQLEESQLSLINVRRLVIYMKKVIGPFLYNYLEDPNDVKTWKQIYLAVKPFLDGLANKRALQGGENVGWSWQGDQFANSEKDYVINNPTDVGLGKYKIRLFIKPTPSLQEITIDITLSHSGVSFEEALGLVGGV